MNSVEPMPISTRAGTPRIRGFWAAAFVLALVLYSATLAPGLLWSDSAEYHWRIALADWRGSDELVRAHVLFVLLGRGLHLLTGISPALAGNLVTALAGAVTVANVALGARLLGASLMASMAAAAALATAHAFWQMATISEVYTLSAALLSAEILCLTCFARTQRTVLLPLCGLLNGLGVANHNQALLSLGCYVLIAVLVGRQRLLRNGTLILATAAAWLIGFMPLLLLMVRQWAGGEMTLVQVLRDWLVGPFHTYVFNVRLSAAGMIKVAAMMGLSFPSAAWFIAPFGVRPLFEKSPKWLAALVVTLFGAHFLFAVRYPVHDQYTFFIPAYVMMAYPLSAGVDRLLTAARLPRWLRWTLVLTLFVAPVVYAVLPPVVARLPRDLSPLPTWKVPYRDNVRWFIQPWHTGSREAERFAREALALLPDDGIVLIDMTQGGPLLYAQAVFGLKPGVQINDRRLEGAPQPIDEVHVARWVAQGRLFTSAPGSRSVSPADQWVLEKYAVEPLGVLSRVVPMGE